MLCHRQQSQGLLPPGTAFDLFRGTAASARDEVETYPTQLAGKVVFGAKTHPEVRPWGKQSSTHPCCVIAGSPKKPYCPTTLCCSASGTRFQSESDVGYDKGGCKQRHWLGKSGF